MNNSTVELEKLLTIAPSEGVRVNMARHILKRSRETYYKKNSDYGNAFMDTYTKYGVVSFVVRLEDKFSRLRSLIDNNDMTVYHADNLKIDLLDEERQVADETIEDTLGDIVNYLIMYVMAVNSIKYDDAMYNLISKGLLTEGSLNDNEAIYALTATYITNFVFEGMMSMQKAELPGMNSYLLVQMLLSPTMGTLVTGRMGREGVKSDE